MELEVEPTENRVQDHWWDIEEHPVQETDFKKGLAALWRIQVVAIESMESQYRYLLVIACACAHA